MRRAALLVVIGCLVLVGAAAPATAVPVIYSGQITTGSGGGHAWSYGYEIGGAALFALDPASAFAYTFDDINGNGLDGGDRIDVNATLDIVDYSGDLFGAHSLGAGLGTLTLAGSFTVGTTTGGYFTNALDGSLSYTVAFSGAPSHNAVAALAAGDTLSGTVTVAGGILGYGDGQPDLRFNFSGDGAASTRNGQPGGAALGFGIGIQGVQGDCNDFPTAPGCAQSVPEPASLALLAAGLLALGVVSSQRGRR